MDQTACIDLPAFPLQLLLRKHPDWREHPAAANADGSTSPYAGRIFDTRSSDVSGTPKTFPTSRTAERTR